jgi:hypothetical protein
MISINTWSAMVLVLTMREYSLTATFVPVASVTVEVPGATAEDTRVCTRAVSAKPEATAANSSAVLSRLASRIRVALRRETNSRVLNQADAVHAPNRLGRHDFIRVALFDYATFLEK